MKRSLALLAFISLPAAAYDVSSHTFFSVRPLFQSASPEHVSLCYDRADAAVNGHGGAVRVSMFGGRSTHPEQLAKFFLPYGKTCISFGELGSNAFLNDSVDLISNYFGVATGELVDGRGSFQQDNLTSQGCITMCPRQSTVGFGLVYKQRLALCSNGKNNDRGAWFSISMPIMGVKNSINFTEKITTQGTGTPPSGYVGTITEALRGDTIFGNKRFCYGKIPYGSQQITNVDRDCCRNSCNYCGTCCTSCCQTSCKQTKWGVADIELKIGYLHTHKPDHALESYVGLIIPTGNKPTGQYIFEPIVGNNNHFGCCFGGTCAHELHKKNEQYVWLEVSGHGQYLLSNRQCRSFDLVNKDWSRYIWVYKDNTAQPFYGIEPGINYLTQPARVSPRFSGNVNTCLMFSHKKFVGEFGYNVYARSAEKVQLCCFPTGIGIAGFDFEQVTAEIRTQSPATMKLFDAALDDETTEGEPRFVPLRICDINCESAAHPAVISHTFYGTLGCRWDEDADYPKLFTMGSSYEYSGDNAGLNRWLLWGSFTISF